MSLIESKAPASQDPRIASFRAAIDRMAEQAAASRDGALEEKYRELSSKLAENRLTIAFCGHFSAGKSTLVNALCGASLLPSSPIPTSANVVTIVNGEPAAEMAFRRATGETTPVKPIEIEQLHDFAVDGEGVSSIRVSYPIPLLGDRMAIVDTPGVDSTDGAHRAATESALHLADVVFYVTDYNHVQSEVNFRFLRSLARWGKPTYLIVNQIDKHREDQLTFPEFRDSLRQALHNWDIRLAGIVFLSLREKEHPLSQWNELQRLMKELQPLATSLILRSASKSAAFLADQFRKTLHQRNQDARDKALATLEETTKPQLDAERDALNKKLEEIMEAGVRRRERLRVEMDKMLASANLTPAETRDKAKDALEAMQPGFKAGWLASAAKTQAERERRLAALATDFNGQASANVQGHARELLRLLAKEAGEEGESVENALEAAFGPVSVDWLKQRVKPGAGADGQATLHYSAEISADLKSAYRKTALEFGDRLLESLQPGQEAAAAGVRAQLEGLRAKTEAIAVLERLEAEESAEQSRLLAMLPEGAEAGGETMELPEVAPVLAEAVRTVSEDAERTQLADAPSQAGGAAATDAEESGSDRLDVPNGAAERLERAAAHLYRLPALKGMADGLAAKARKFRDKRFTIALFGAFSAGKSSFANALVGQPVLPVSPNPTTAAINRILAPTGDGEHGTALVTMKTAEAFAEDVRHSLKRLGIDQGRIAGAGDDLTALLALKGQIEAGELHPRGRPHLAFLKAAENGLAQYGQLLGQSFLVTGEVYRRYASEEQASCFVSEIDLYVDSPLTRSGAVLVDTPGADSINARHTGVAFQYIKNADAVLFVTYYNHAFTEADREFLNQLGSVKDVFELDKMFFVINAADLASSDKELESVSDHVSGQLLKHGIRKPRLYPVSSLLGVQAKMKSDAEGLEKAGIAAFERAFRAFSAEELGGLALASANKELERVDKTLDSWLKSANEDASTRDMKAERLLEQARKWKEQGASMLSSATVQPLLQEAAEQLFHLRQRIRFRYNEHFQSAFHPSVLQDDGRDLKKMLVACWEDLQRSLGEDLLQELRAATLRLEAMLRRTVETVTASRVEQANELLEGFEPEAPETFDLELPLYEPFAGGPLADGKRLWSAFRSPKQFFENEGAKALREQSGQQLFETIDSELAELKEKWNDKAAESLRQALISASRALADQLFAFAQSLSQSLREPGEEKMLADFYEQWKRIRQ